MNFLQTSSAAALLGVLACEWAARRRGERAWTGLVLALMALVSGLIGAHLVAVLVYDRATLLANPAGTLLSLTRGIASAGGFLGGVLGGAAFARLSGRSMGSVGDLLAVSVALCWPLARSGCALAHDHPGLRSEFLLAVSYSDGSRHDLGLYEALVAVPILALTLRSFLRGTANGGTFRTFLWSYCSARFALDFLRTSGEDARVGLERGAFLAADVDPRWLGLTFAQWLAAATLVALALRPLRQKLSVEPARL
jgi:phosphatidylglycerol:prolipoprotein diacylglycerol transferase